MSLAAAIIMMVWKRVTLGISKGFGRGYDSIGVLKGLSSRHLKYLRLLSGYCWVRLVLVIFLGGRGKCEIRLIWD